MMDKIWKGCEGIPKCEVKFRNYIILGPFTRKALTWEFYSMLMQYLGTFDMS
jgi:hypothetical protein